ncbi:hypothetical protein BHM03_00039783 [Ensete ventricosum]|nr:hypothetical protein BHM03_00039783 [Ensete ventricosum]
MVKLVQWLVFAIHLPRRGARAYIVGVVDHPYLTTRLSLWLTLSSYASTTLVVLPVRDASTGEGIDLTCVRLAVRPLGYRPYLCQVGRTTAGVSALPVPGRPHDLAPLYLRPTSFPFWVGHVGGLVVRRSNDVAARSLCAISFFPPGEDLLEVPDEGAEDEVLCLAAGSRWP